MYGFHMGFRIAARKIMNTHVLNETVKIVMHIDPNLTVGVINGNCLYQQLK